MITDKRTLIIAALCTTPSAEHFREAVNGRAWIDVLRDAGIVGETWRPSRGVLCAAKDGHSCRSLGERSICDWLLANDIEHSVEPRYPRHPEFNPNSRLRADWQLGEVFVEFAGMMGDKKYEAKIAAKRQLAQEAGLPLVVLLPEDLLHLASRLGPLV